jgi:integrase
MRFARRCGWIVADPVEPLEHDERPRPQRRRQRVLSRAEIERLLAACSPRDRTMLATVLYTGLRISEMLGLVWDDVDFPAGVIHVRAQLSRAHRSQPARRVAPKTPASVRDIPLVAQLARLLSAHRQGSQFARGDDWVFATARGTPYGHRNVSRRALGRAARLPELNDDGWPPLRFHDLRHTFASHLIIDLGVDVAQVSRILGHARITTTLDIYTHLFEDARHARDIRTRMAASPFAALLEPTTAASSATVLKLRSHARSEAPSQARPRAPPNLPRVASRPAAPSRRPHW